MKYTKTDCPKCNKKVSVPAEGEEVTITCPECSLRWLWEPPKQQEGGFFSRLKNAVTGGGAELSFEIEEPIVLGHAFAVKVHVKIAGNALKNDGVFLQVRLRENIVIPWYKVLQSHHDVSSVLTENSI